MVGKQWENHGLESLMCEHSIERQTTDDVEEQLDIGSICPGKTQSMENSGPRDP